MECLIGIGASIVGKITEYTVDPVVRRIGYCLYYKRNVERLKDQIQDLKFAKERVDHSVAAARDDCGIIEKDVEQWLSKADSISGEAEKLVSIDEGLANTSCSSKSFSKLMKRYKLGKEAKKMGSVISEVKEAGKFSKVYYRLPPSDSFKIKGYEEFETRANVFKGIMKALKDVGVRTIGVWGMGGVGKTMLVQAVSSHAESEKLFTPIVFTTISQTPDYKSIQQEVADTLGLKFEENTIATRAKRLRDRLRGEEKILIIIDDIWSKLDLDKVGLSLGDDQKECKILLTSRSQDVLLDEMGVDRGFPIGVLSLHEATSLFNQIAGDLHIESEFQNVKKKIVEKCAGLPLAISVVAKALKNKSISVWEDALLELSRSNPVNIRGVEKEVYSVIRWSYDFLQSEEAKLLLVLCSLHKEDEEISVQALLMYGMGLRSFHGTRKLKDVRNRVFHLVETLKSSSLLLHGNSDNHVRMHDVIRDVILSVASKDRQMYFVRNTEELSDRLNDNELEDSTAISIHFNKDTSNLLPEILSCPKLHLFSLSKRNESSLEIPHQFFEVAKDLRVLSLVGVGLNLPRLSSFCSLNNLKTLTCSSSTLGDIACIGELKCLEILDMSGSDLKVVPKQLGNLTRLLSLDLSYCFYLKVIEAGVISSFTRLEELSIRRPSFTRWASLTEVCGENRGNARLNELKQATHLTTFHLDIIDANNVLPDDLFVDKLERFEICVTSSSNEHFAFNVKHRLSRSLILNDVNDSLLERICLKPLIKRAENLFIRGVKIEKSFVDLLVEEGHLKVLTLSCIFSVRYVIDTYGSRNVIAFRNLEELYLTNLIKLETICNGSDLSVDSMAKLRVIFVQGCRLLKNLFPLSFSYRRLVNLHVFDCEAMEDIFINFKNDDEMIGFPRLRFVELEKIPKLKQFVVGSPSSQRGDDDRCSLFHHKVAFPALKKLKLEALDSMKMIWPGDEHELMLNNYFCKLQVLSIRNCKKLTRLCSSTMLRRLRHLKDLIVLGCDTMEDLFEIRNPPVFEETLETVITPQISFDSTCPPTLERLLSYVEQFNQVGSVVTSNKLKKVEVSHCSRLKNLFPASIAKDLPELESIQVTFCYRIQEIIAYEEGAEEIVPKFAFPRLSKLYLETLPELRSLYRNLHFCEWPSLSELTIKGCDKVRILASQLSDSAPLFYVNTVAFPRLKTMELYSLNQLEMIWQCDQELVAGSFGELERVTIRCCGTLTKVFSHNLPGNLGSLIYLTIEYCAKVEEVFEMQRPVSGEPVIISLTYIHLSTLPNLKQFIGGSPAPQPKDDSWPLFHHKVAFPTLTNLSLEKLDSLKMIWPDDDRELMSDGNFCNLKALVIVNCKKLTRVCSSIMLRRLQSVTYLRVDHCDMLEEVIEIRNPIADKERLKIVISPLSSLILNSLPKLKHLVSYNEQCPQLGTSVTFSKLKRVQVSCCSSLKAIFPAAVAKGLLELESIRLDNCGRIREIIAKEEGTSEIVHTFVFPRLSTLYLKNLFELECLYRNLHCSEWPSLSELTIEFCGKVKILATQLSNYREATVSGNTPLFIMDTVAFPRLKKMDLCLLLQMEMIWQDGQELVPGSFGKLESISIRYCGALVNVFSLTSLENLGSLTELIIESCFKVEEVFEMQIPKRSYKVRSGRPSFITPKLKKVKLTECPSLKSLFPSSLAEGLLELESIQIEDCSQMQQIISCEKEAPEMIPKFEFPQLTWLSLSNLPELKCLYPDLHTSNWPSLSGLKLVNCVKLKIWASQLSTFKMNTIQDARINAPIFMMETVTFPMMSSMILKSLDVFDSGDRIEEKMNHVPSIASILPNLKGLLFPSFKHLTTLVVLKCGFTGSLFDPSTARSLSQLTSLGIAGCESMTEVIGDALEEEEEGDIVFSNLEILVLACLPKLVSFHTGSDALLFPSLEKLVVVQCPEMRRFSCEAVTSKLGGIITRTKYIEPIFFMEQWCDYHESFYPAREAVKRAKPVEERWDGDINSTLQNRRYSSEKIVQKDIDASVDSGDEEGNTSYSPVRIFVTVSSEITEVAEEDARAE